MNGINRPKRPSLPAPAFCMLIASLGLFPIAGVYIFDQHNPATDAPKPVILVCGLVFVFFGLSMALAKHPRVRAFLGVVGSLCMGTAAGWVCLFTSADEFSGGISFLPDTWNLILFRLLSGGGAFACYFFALYLLKQVFENDQKKA